MRQQKRTFAALLAGWVLLLTGCNEDNRASSGKPLPPETPVVAYDGLATAKVQTLTTVDLTPYIRGENPSIKQVTATQPENCLASTSEGLKVDVTVVRPGRCDYTYTVVDARGAQSSAELVVVSSEETRPLLPAGSVATTLGTNVVVELVPLLGSGVIPDGYALSELNAQHEQGSEPVSTLTQTGPLTFSFTAPEVFGWNYISYVLTNASTGSAMIGSVFVSVADTINTAPEVTPQLMVYSSSVELNEVVTVDLANTPGLTINDDSGQWRLQSVKALGATVTPVAPDNTTNKAFTFQANAVGTYDVAYIVSDYVGGATMGIIRFNVDSVPITPTKPWKDISTGGKVYTAPLTHSEAKEYGNAQYGIETINGSNYQVARWGNTAAAQYCDTIGGRLPTLSELKGLYNATGDAATERAKWPVNIAYLSHDAQYGLVSLKDGSWSQYVAGYEAYVTCIDRGLAKLEIEPQYTNDGENTTEDSLIAGKTMDIKATLTMKNGGLPIEGIDITATLQSQTNPSAVYFDLAPSKTLSLTPKESKTLSVGQCVTQCINTTSYKCTAVQYDRLTDRCQLYSETPKPSDFVAADSNYMVYARNDVLRGIETVSCPSATDVLGTTFCQYSNTITGTSDVNFTAEQGYGIDNASTSSSVLVTPDLASERITAPTNAYVPKLGPPTLIRVAKSDQYGNEIPSIKASITANQANVQWTLDSVAGSNPSVTYPNSSNANLEVLYALEDIQIPVITASMVSSSTTNPTVSTVTKISGNVTTYPCPAGDGYDCVPLLPSSDGSIYYIPPLTEQFTLLHPELHDKLKSAEFNTVPVQFEHDSINTYTNMFYIDRKPGQTTDPGLYCEILGNHLFGSPAKSVNYNYRDASAIERDILLKLHEAILIQNRGETFLKSDKGWTDGYIEVNKQDSVWPMGQLAIGHTGDYEYRNFVTHNETVVQMSSHKLYGDAYGPLFGVNFTYELFDTVLGAILGYGNFQTCYIESSEI